MMDLHPCPACARHVRSSEQACPFCQAVIDEGPAPRPDAVAAGLGRAARMALGAALASTLTVAGCGGDDSTSDPVDSGRADARVDAQADARADAADGGSARDGASDAMTQPDVPLAMPYGAPPRRSRRVVV